MRILTASIYYVVAKVNGFVLLDVDMLPLQGEHWQTDQMLSAYFSLLASRFSTPLSLKFNLDFTSVESIVTGTGVKKYLAMGSTLPLSSVSMCRHLCSSENLDALWQLSNYVTFQAAYNKIGEVDIIFGPYHKGQNHWTLIYIDLKREELLYIDPLGHNEIEVAQEIGYRWLEWALLHNTKCPQSVVPANVKAVTVKHALQCDGRNCGIFTMCVRNLVLQFTEYCATKMYEIVWKAPKRVLLFSFIKQFAKRLLQGTSVAEVVPGYEGATIAAEILDASDSLRDLCAKCGRKLTNMDGPLLTCSGICAPRRTFHSMCVPSSRRSDLNFSCQVCNPGTREDFCFRCNDGPSGDIHICANNDTRGCTNFVHTRCLGARNTLFSCGLC